MPFLKWNPFEDLITLHHELFGEGSGLGVAPESSSAWTPPVDIYETEDAFILRAELPGINPEHLRVEHTTRELTLSGEKPSHKESTRTYYWLERYSGPFRRTFILPEHVCCEEIEASYEDGVLEIIVPKRSGQAVRTIPVQS